MYMKMSNKEKTNKIRSVLQYRSFSCTCICRYILKIEIFWKGMLNIDILEYMCVCRGHVLVVKFPTNIYLNDITWYYINIDYTRG